MVVQGRVARLVLRVRVLAVVDQVANLVCALGEVEFLREKASNLFEVRLERVVAADVVAQDVLDNDECRTSGAVERIPIDVLPPNQRLDGLDVPAGAREVEGVTTEELARAELLCRTLARVDLGEDTPMDVMSSLEDAVTLSAAAAQPGDTVLLSPACASFDQFRDFEARGDAFAAAVAALE